LICKITKLNLVSFNDLKEFYSINLQLAMRNIYFLFFILITPCCFAQKTPISTKPKLIIGLVVDQMRYDYLYKYANNYGTSGFKKLLAKGFSCENTNLNYVPSVTGCGHACIYTGSIPAIHGIASNDWYDKSTGKMMYCAQDNTVTSVGEDTKSGKMSPRNMLTTTIGDELKLATNGRSKVIGVALKDRGSILPAGHSADAAYWMDDSLGKFITSSYYMQQVPNWVQQFNDAEPARKYLQEDWNTILPMYKYYQSTADDNKFEGRFKVDSTTAFPHKTNLFKKTADIKRTPYGNNITLDFSKQAIVNYNLGKGTETDFIAISLSSTDYIGHQFGINSIEIEDTYYRLDKDLANFLQFVDKQVGVGNYTLFLTADHGAAHNPTYLQSQKIPSGFLFSAALKKSINDKGMAKFGKNVIVDMGDNQVWVNDTVDKTEAINYVMQELKAVNQIQFVVENEKLTTAVIPDAIKQLAINGYYPNRSGDILFILKPAFIESYNNATTGTTHGTWNPYDTHIPLVWYGNGINKGKNFQQVYMTDIAATLAALLQIQVPNGCIGKPIEAVLK
jgi:predicted AlkP superfamily pyrophosphatase or phosphodiesterase